MLAQCSYINQLGDQDKLAASTSATKLLNGLGHTTGELAREGLLRNGLEPNDEDDCVDHHQHPEDATSQSLLEMSQFDNFTQMLFRLLPAD